MKHLSLLLATLILVRSAAPAQSLPDNPTPVLPPDPMWERLENLVPGTPIAIRNDNGPPVHCLFASATDEYLFCDPPGNPPSVGFRLDRAAIAGVDLDWRTQNVAQFERPQRNYHPAWIASMLAGGLIVGICATRTMDDGSAARAGAIGALVVGVIGAPLAFLPHSMDQSLAYRPRGFVPVRIPRFTYHPRMLPRPTNGR